MAVCHYLLLAPTMQHSARQTNASSQSETSAIHREVDRNQIVWLQAQESNPVFRGYEPRGLPVALPAEFVAGCIHLSEGDRFGHLI